MNEIRNEYISGPSQAGQFVEQVQETNLKLFRHVQRRDSVFAGQRMLHMKLHYHTERKQEDHKKRHAKSARDKVRRRQMICCGEPSGTI